MCKNLPGAEMSTKRVIYIAVLAQSLKEDLCRHVPLYMKTHAHEASLTVVVEDKDLVLPLPPCILYV